MHIEILVEDSSGQKLLEALLPKLLGEQGAPNTWRTIAYRGVGRIPKNLNADGDPAKRILLDRLPSLLRGYGRTPGYDAVVVVVDSDSRDCREFLAELKSVADSCDPAPNTVFRLAIEEIEAWYLGDRSALLKAYPKAKKIALDRYVQDSPCGTWEILADAIYPGGTKSVKIAGWPLPGQIKHEWATRIGPLLDPARNDSPSFRKFVDGVNRLVEKLSRPRNPV
jgi:hypothetical protein